MVRELRNAAAALLLVSGVPCAAECVLSSQDSARLEAITSAPEPSEQSRQVGRGIFYLDLRCYAEARKALSAGVEGTSNRLRGAAAGLLQLLDALELAKSGEPRLARDKVVALLKESMSMPVLERAPYVLADLLDLAPDPEAASFLEEELRKAAQSSWMATAFQVKRRLAEGRGAEALGWIEAELAGELNAVRRIELQVLLAYLLLAQKRLAEAQILVTRLDQEVGETILDPGLRVNFLGLAVQVWMERVRVGGDPTAHQKLAAYSAALRQLPSHLKPWGLSP